MKWLIVTDSSCDLTSLDTGSSDIGFDTVPFVLNIDGKDFVDHPELSVPEMVDAMEASSASHSACPSPSAWEELSILVGHDVPCGLTVNILNAEGRTIRRLAYETPSRPQQLSPAGSTFYWDGMQTDGSPAPAGQYTVQAKVRLGGRIFSAESEPITLLSREAEQESGGSLPQDPGTDRKDRMERPLGQVFRSVRSILNAVLSSIGGFIETLAKTRPNQTSP